MRRSWPVLIIVGVLLLLGGGVHAGPAYSFRSIDLSGATATRAFGINAEADIVGVYAIGSVSHSYLLSRGTVMTIDPPAPYGLPGTSQAWGINPAGEIVGQYTDTGTVPGGDALRTRAFFRDAYGNFTRIDFPGAENTLAIKISPTGLVVGCYHHQNSDTAASVGGTMHGYIYQNGNYQSLSQFLNVPDAVCSIKPASPRLISRVPT